MNSLKRSFTGKANLKKKDNAQKDTGLLKEKKIEDRAKEQLYFGSYSLYSKKPIFYELCEKVKGVGFSNCLYILKESLKDRPIEVLKEITLAELSQKETLELQTLVEQSVLPLNHSISNRKKTSYSTDLKELDLGFNLKTDNIILGDALKSTISIDIRRLKSSKCYIGNRHTLNRPVHGQNFRCSGRSRKMLGFQKEKLLRNEKLKRN